MHKFLVILLLLSVFCFKSYAQTEKITGFTFETFSRGYKKTINISPDSVIITELNQPKKVIRRKTQAGTWANLLKSISDYKLAELTNLKSPTQNRDRDAARYSSITIKTSRNSYNSGYFDGHNPHQKLQRLMSGIIQVENNKL